MVGVLIEVWQDRNPSTIAQGITLPTFVAMLVGIALVTIGFGRCLAGLEPRARRIAGLGGSVLAAALGLGAVAWQLRAGLPSGGNLDLDSYAAGALAFLGVAIVARSIVSLAGPEAGRPNEATDVGGWGLGAGLGAAGAAALAVAVATVPWLDGPVHHVTSLYALLTIEAGGAGTWFVLAGYGSAVRDLAGPALRAARRLGFGVGAALAAAGGLWWGASARVVDAQLIACVALVLAGIGLVALALRRTDEPIAPVARLRSAPD